MNVMLIVLYYERVCHKAVALNITQPLSAALPDPRTEQADANYYTNTWMV